MPKVPLLVSLLVFAGCGGDDGGGAEGGCVTSSECGPEQACIDGECVSRRDGGPPDGGPDAGACDCVAGEVCTEGTCADDCGNPEAVPCADGDTCDYAAGRCVAVGTPGILTGDGQECGDGGRTCLPGSECSASGECVPAPPCFAVSCSESRDTCWGRSCVSERPAGACSPPVLERMNMADFIGGGDGGAFDLEFDDSCNAYTVTMISGTDYLRQLEPDGTLTVWDGVTNLNMGEVAVLRVPGSEFGAGDDGLGQVALTYVCCATCGCVSTDPQGVAQLDRAGPTHLPMVVTATPSTGDGPFGRPELDTGPYGLTWGRDDRLYVGNVAGQGDLVRADLGSGTTETIHELGARIHASTTFDPTSLLVAVEGGTVYRVGTDASSSTVWTEVGEDVTSMVRDPFTGRVYVSVAGATISEYDADGTLRRELDTTPAAGRLAYAPDGFLYFLVPGWPGPGQVLRYELPNTL